MNDQEIQNIILTIGIIFIGIFGLLAIILKVPLVDKI